MMPTRVYSAKTTKGSNILQPYEDRGVASLTLWVTDRGHTLLFRVASTQDPSLSIPHPGSSNREEELAQCPRSVFLSSYSNLVSSCLNSIYFMFI